MRELLNIVEHLFANAFSRVSWLDMAPQVRRGRVLLCAHSAQSPVKLQEEAPQAEHTSHGNLSEKPLGGSL